MIAGVGVFPIDFDRLQLHRHGIGILDRKASKTLGLNHDFLLLDRVRDGEWEQLRFIHDPRAIHLHDDFVRYMEDTLAWIPTTNPARGEPHRGLCMWGPTLIEAEGASVAERVFGGWAELLAAGPPRLGLTGGFS